MITKRSKKRMKGIERVLEGEDVIDAVSGAVDGKVLGNAKGKQNGVLVLTGNRVIFYYKKMLGGYMTEDYPISKISSVNFGMGMMGGEIKLHASGNDLHMVWIPKDEGAEEFAKAIKSQMVDQKQETKVPSNDEPDVADQIKKLADLKDQGILTEDEFTTKKKQLLGI